MGDAPVESGGSGTGSGDGVFPAERPVLAGRDAGRRGVVIRAGFLFLAALLACVVFPDAAGLRNVQEGLRALPSLEMRERGDWLVPTLFGDPYLAKPPLVYWLTLGLWGVVGGESPVLPLRLATGLSGALAVVLTYLCGRAVLLGDDREGEGAGGDGETAAFLAACCLLAGPLHVHQSRSGEIDILTSAPTVVGVWAAVSAGRCVGRAMWVRRLVLLACLALLALAKGPPGMLVLIVAAIGGVVVFGSHRRGGALGRRGRVLAFGVVPAVMFVGLLIKPVLGLVNGSGGFDPRDWVGALIATGLAALAASAVGRTFGDRGALGVVFERLRRARVLVLGVIGLAPFLGWYLLATRGARAMTGGADGAMENPVDLGGVSNKQTVENLIPFVADAPAQYAEAWVYAAGPGSVAAVIALIWLLKDRPWFGAGGSATAAWAVGPVLVFGLLGRGTARYITAAWPGVALFGGLWLAAARRDFAWGAGVARALPVIGAVASVGFALWYGPVGAPHREHLSPRGLLGEIAGMGLEIDGVATLNMQDATFDVHAREAGLSMLGHLSTDAEIRKGFVDSRGVDSERFVVVLSAMDARDATRRARRAGLVVESVLETGIGWRVRGRDADAFALVVGGAGGEDGDG